MQSLLEPLRFANGATAPNRVWLAPLTNLQSHPDGTLSDDELAWLVRRAEGGFGVVETCAAHVARDGQAWAGELGVFDDDLLPGLTRLAGALGARGAASIVQLFHGGVRADPTLTGAPVWSASAFVEEGVPVPRAATEDDLATVIARFRDAALRCHRAGFTGIELHGAHGYLFGQFLSATQNQRADRWGGALANRARLLLDTLRAVRAAVPAAFVVGVRLSPEDFGQARGLDLDESLAVAGWLAEAGADFVHVSLWNATRNTRKRPDQHPLPLFRAALPPEVALVAAGGVWTRAEADALLALGADAVALGRAAIVNPDWPREAAAAGWEPRRPPLTLAELEARAVSPTFGTYLRRWKGFVAD